MTLRSKTLVTVGISFVCLIAILYASSNIIIMRSFKRLENNEVNKSVKQASNALSDEYSALDTNGADWADWDDTYNFIENDNNAYIASNLVDSTFTQLRINVILFVNSAGHVIFGEGYDLNSDKEVPVPQSLSAHLALNDPLLTRRESLTGLIMLPEGPMVVDSRPILTSDEKGPSRGWLIMGRYLDSVKTGNLAKTTSLPVSLERFDSPRPPQDFQSARTLLSNETPIVVRPLDQNTIAGYARIMDIYGHPGLILRVSVPRSIYKQGQLTISYLLLSLLLVSLVFLGLSLLVLEKLILSRLTRLNAGVTDIGRGGSPSARLPVTGTDELADLTAALNAMLDALDESRSGLMASEERYRRLVELSPDPVIVHSEDQILFINPAGAKLLGSPGEVTGRPIDGLPEGLAEVFRRAAVGTEEVTFSDVTFDRGEGHPVHAALASVRVVYDGKPAVQVVARDVTSRKEMENRLRYLGMHDPLTGLYNRVYFEKHMKRIEEEGIPVTLVVCDVDGLKFVNDTWGHSAGDNLLKVVAGAISRSFAENAVAARIGGDEFAVLIPGSSGAAVDTACRRLTESVVNYNVKNLELPLSLSTGIAICRRGPVNGASLFQEADNNMYREKLLSAQSTRSAIVQTLMKALEARDFITEGHADRLQDLAAGLAQAMGLSEHRITALRLLAQFHDVGKVGIPDRILFKPGPLTPEERAEMQRHSEIGHRIAQAAPDLVTIADWILKHHERWDGTGYPLGLRGGDIPLECRILALADAFDAMTQTRPYRRAMALDKALAEIERCSGTQFDPGLVPLFTRLIMRPGAETGF